MINSDKKQIILVVNDDLPSPGAIEEILKRDGALEVCLAHSVSEGIRIAREIKPDLLICFWKAFGNFIDICRQIQNDTDPFPPAFLLLSDGADGADIVRCLELGADDYIDNSLCNQVLIPKVRYLLSTRSLSEELRDQQMQLEEMNALYERNFKNFKQLTSILLGILEIRIPGARDRAETAKTIAEFLTDRLGIESGKRQNIIFGAIIHELGKIGLPDEIVGKHYNTVSAEMLTVFQNYTTIGAVIISTMTGYRESAEAVHHQLENYDGSGFPDGLMGNDIKVGARILRAIVFQEDLQARGFSAEDIIDRIRLAMHTILDMKIANLLIEFLQERNEKPDSNRLKISLDELKEGMMIAEDVYAASGIKLVPKGVRVREKMLAIIMERNKVDPIIGGVYIINC
jgi:response regulator RpfG family c-di-GMP phosphodiesterase